MRAEFDFLADEYESQHRINVAITGESPDYFAQYKVVDLALLVKDKGFLCHKIIDFGCGIGNSIPFFRKHFSQSELYCSDVSTRSIEIAKSRFPGQEFYVEIKKKISLPINVQDIVFSACVFHHIPHDEHQYWLTELIRVTRPGGLLVIYEHNPINPLTLYAVNTCPFDINARLIRSGKLKKTLLASGWKDVKVDYKLFFPSALKFLRPIERYLGWLCIGAQYRISARKPD